jgi:hypothetical protein
MEVLSMERSSRRAKRLPGSVTSVDAERVGEMDG